MAKTRRERWSQFSLLASVLVISAIAVLAVVVIVTGDDDESPEDSAASTSPPAEPTETDTAIPAGFVDLPAPDGMTKGYPTGYPHSPEGATALVAAYNVESAVLDYDAADDVTAAYIEGASPTDADAGVTSNRQTMEIPLNGPPPADAAVQLTVEGVDWTVRDADSVVVSTSFRIDFTLPDGETRVATGASSVPVVWSGGRWWIDATDESAMERLDYAKPGSSAYQAAEWKVIRNDDWMGDRS